MRLETNRLTLRRFSKDDWQDLYQYLSDEMVVKYEPYGVFSEEDCIEAAMNRSHNDAFWAVCLKENGKLIGNIFFQQQEPEEFLCWSIGYVFNSLYWGRGYATESALAVLGYGFEKLSTRRVVAMCNPNNVASWHLLERLGMRREAHFLKHKFFKRDAQGKPIWTDTFVYAILAEERSHLKAVKCDQ